MSRGFDVSETTQQDRPADGDASPSTTAEDVGFPDDDAADLPSNWEIERDGTTEQDTRYFMLTGTFSKPHTTLTKLVVVHHAPEEAEWAATRITPRGQDDEPVATGELDEVAPAAVQAAHNINDEYLDVDIISLPTE